MKKIVKGNDFTLKIPVMKMVEGQAQAFPLPACTDIVVQVCNQFKRIPLAFEIDVKEDNVLLARVEGDQMSLGTYAIEVKGKIFGNDWRSNEYPQFAIVSNNADADTEFGETDEGDNSVEMDTAMVILPPTVELSDLISDTNEALGKVDNAVNKTEEAVKKANDAVSQVNGALEKVQNVDIDIDGTNLNITRPSGEEKEFDLMQLKGEKGDQGIKGDKGEQGLQGERGEQGLPGNDGAKGDIGLTGPQGETGPVGPQGVKGDPFTYDDFTEEEIKELQKPATDAAAKAQEVLKKAETATAGAEKVDATLANDVLTVTNRNGESTSLQLASYAEVGDVVSEVKHLSETMGAYSDRPDITLVAKETNKAISADGVKVTKAGWAIAEFTAEKGNEYLFKPNVIDGSVCVFAEYITSIETRGIDYTYTYNEDGTIATATATYLGKTHVYTYEWTVEAGVNTPTIKEGDTVINNLPMTYETKVGTYSPLVKLNEDAELPVDGYCRYMSHFKGNSSIKIVVSYKVGTADLTMKVLRDGVLASISTQLGNLSQKEDETRKKVEEYHGSYAEFMFNNDTRIIVDGKNIIIAARVKTRVYPKKSLVVGDRYSKKTLIYADVANLDTSGFTTFNAMFANCNILSELNLSAWDTSQVTSMAYMFSGCSSLTSLNLSAWDTTSLGKGVKESVKDTGIYMMFYGSGNIKTLDMGGDGWNFVNIPSSNSFYRPLESRALTEWKLGKNFFKGRFVNQYYNHNDFNNWSKSSFIESIVTNSYDRRANGYDDVTLYFVAKLKNYLSEDDIATMTAKGYIIA
nr:MAG TPA: protein of unknown function DUF285 [Caudoviricetes sp.]